jgi:hypothetical protein
MSFGFFEPMNLFEEFDWIEGKYYVGGVLTDYSGAISTKPIKLFPGAMIWLSVFDNNPSARVSFWKDGVWVSDLSAGQTMGRSYVTIPSNCNEISMTMLSSLENKKVCIWGNQIIYDSVAILSMIRSTYIKKENILFKNKKFSILGDSVSYGNSNILWWKKLAEENNMTLISNQSDEDITFVSYNNEPEGTVHLADMSRIESLANNSVSPEVFFLYGGLFDILKDEEDSAVNGPGVLSNQYSPNYTQSEIQNFDVSNYVNALFATIMRIQYTFTGVNIVCIIPYFALGNNGVTSNLRETGLTRYDLFNLYADSTISLCNALGIKYVDLRKCGIPPKLNNNYIEEITIGIQGILPNEEGMKLIFEEINRLV